MVKNSSAEKRSHDSELPGSSQANQDSQQTGTSNEATARDGREPGPKRRATSGGLIPDLNQPIPPLGERPTLQETVVSVLGPAAFTRGVQKSVDKLNKLGTELKVRAFLKDLKEADERSRENAAKWLKVFCDQICVKGCADKSILTPNVVLTWVIQRPDLFDIEALERLIRYCTSGNFPYIPAQNDNQDLVEEKTEENNQQGAGPDEGKTIQDPEEKISQDAPGNGEEAQQKKDVPSKDGEQAKAKGEQNNEDPYGAGPSHRLRPIPKPVGIGIKMPSTDYRKGPSRVRLSSPGKISPHSDDNSDIEMQEQDDDTVEYLSGSEPELDVLNEDADSDSDTETVDITDMLDIESEP